MYLNSQLVLFLANHVVYYSWIYSSNDGLSSESLLRSYLSPKKTIYTVFYLAFAYNRRSREIASIRYPRSVRVWCPRDFNLT